MPFSFCGRRCRRNLIVIFLLAVLALALTYLPTGYFVVSPGMTKDVSEMVTVIGGTKAPGAGHFLMTTVATREANFWLLLYGALDPASELRPKSDFLPPGKTLEEYIQETERMMQQSQDYARAAALRALGYPVEIKGDGAKVLEVVPGSPAQGNLQPGDIITAVADQPVRRVEDLLRIMGEVPVGSRVTVKFRRGEQEQQIVLPTVENTSRPGRAMLGVRSESVNETFRFPVEIKIDADHITGPSAGLMFALEIVRQLKKDVDLTGGRVIAGTGTIDASGKVGPIGGIGQKVITAERAGAVVFLAPRENYEEALRAARKITVVPVSSLQDALEFLKK